VEINPWTAKNMDALIEAIGDARVVMLGEAWHGDGAAIALRSQLVKVLHERLGFDVLAFEADFYGLHRSWTDARRTGSLTAVKADVWPFWVETEAAAPIWRYVEDQMRRGDTLHVAGIDPQIHGRTSRERLPGELRQRLATLPGANSDSVEAVVEFVTAALRRDAAAIKAMPASRPALFGRYMQRLEVEATSAGDGFWARVAASQIARSRDRGMGENLIWLATEQYPNQKIIVWAHNNHVLTNKWTYFESPAALEQLRGTPIERAGRSTYLGDVARDFFGRRLYSIATIPYAGTYSPDIVPVLRGEVADFGLTTALDPAPEGTVEAALAGAGHNLAFVNLRPLRYTVGLTSSRVLDYSTLGPQSLRIADGWDGLLFTRSAFGLNEPTPKEWAKR
jgi:erythromycin esterase